MNRIASSQNPKIKFLQQLKLKSRVRRREGIFLIEGQREVSLAIMGNYELLSVYFCPDIISISEIDALIKRSVSTPEVIEITIEIYQKLAYRTKTEGIIVTARSKDLSIPNLELKNKNPLILVVEAPEKPGNIGALLRTADAAQVDAVLIANSKTDVYNPNIIRSSVGCIFTNAIGLGTTLEIIDYLKQNAINMYGAALQASKEYHKIDYTEPSAIVMGTEDSGLTDEWLINSTQNIKIPMSGVIDSMNVSVAAGILIFEAKRQRNFFVR